MSDAIEKCNRVTDDTCDFADVVCSVPRQSQTTHVGEIIEKAEAMFAKAKQAKESVAGPKAAKTAAQTVENVAAQMLQQVKDSRAVTAGEQSSEKKQTVYLEDRFWCSGRLGADGRVLQDQIKIVNPSDVDNVEEHDKCKMDPGLGRHPL